ncbi:MAG: hypothetical protein HOQ34_18415 [Gemmatimonadaceae bacterium]|nr:hypothetical protein [Gemmatimonadaceae bacterium]
MTDTEALALSRVLYREGGERERKLGEACNAAERSRLYILKHYGDPADWPDASGRRMYYERAVIPHLEGRAALAPEARHD